MDEAIKLARSLGEIAADHKGRAATVTGVRQKLLHADAKACADAAALLHKLSTEVYRLRQGIGCYYYGQLTREELWRMSQTWNGEVARPALPAGKATTED